MILSPQPRFRFYGTPRNYRDVAVALLSGRIDRGGGGPSQLEKYIREYFRVPCALSLPQARLGLFLALKYLIRPGQKVIISPYTFYEVVNTVISAGGRPVFVDIDPASCCIDARQLADQIDTNTGAVVVSYMHGLTGDIETIAKLCRSKGVALVEDAAQCFGGRVGGRYVGTFGDIGVFSFSLKKNLNTFLGGVAVTSDPALHDAMAVALKQFKTIEADRFLRHVVRSLLGEMVSMPVLFQYLTFPLIRLDALLNGGRIAGLLRKKNQPVLRRVMPEGTKRRMNRLQSQLAKRQLADLGRHTRARIEIARLYHQGLAGITRLNLPPFCDDGTHIYLEFPVRVFDRRCLLSYMLLQNRDIELREYGNAADFTCFASYARDCPNARDVAKQVVLLPTYPSYSREEVAKNIAVIRRFYQGPSALDVARH